MPAGCAARLAAVRRPVSISSNFSASPRFGMLRGKILLRYREAHIRPGRMLVWLTQSRAGCGSRLSEGVRCSSTDETRNFFSPE